MPHFTLQISEQHGLLIMAAVGVSQERKHALTTASKTIPALVPIHALIDTGASSTCIDPSVLKSLDLTPTGNCLINTPSTGRTPVPADQYDVSLIIPAQTKEHIPFILSTLAVVCADLLTPQGYHALIGRDVLEHCVLTYNGAAKFFTLAY
jgi:hypothetical protein